MKSAGWLDGWAACVCTVLAQGDFTSDDAAARTCQGRWPQCAAVLLCCCGPHLMLQDVDEFRQLIQISQLHKAWPQQVIQQLPQGLKQRPQGLSKGGGQGGWWDTPRGEGNTSGLCLP